MGRHRIRITIVSRTASMRITVALMRRSFSSMKTVRRYTIPPGLIISRAARETPRGTEGREARWASTERHRARGMMASRIRPQAAVRRTIPARSKTVAACWLKSGRRAPSPPWRTSNHAAPRAALKSPSTTWKTEMICLATFKIHTHTCKIIRASHSA